MTYQVISKTGQKNYIFSQWETLNEYKRYDVVSYQGDIYQANGDMPANTSFVTGSIGMTWTKVIQGGNTTSFIGGNLPGNISIDANGNVTVSAAGVANALVVTAKGTTIAGNLTLASANAFTIPGGNLGDFLSTDGNGHVSWESISGGMATTGVNTTGNITTTGNVSSNNLTITQTITGNTANFTTINTTSNITTQGNVLTNGNITANGGISALGNITTTGNMVASGNIISESSILANGNITSNGTISGNTIVATGPISTAGPVTATEVVSNTTVTANGNITSNSNILANGNITSNATISGNVISGNSITTSGEVTANGNITSNGTVSGNVISGNTVTSNVVSANTANLVDLNITGLANLGDVGNLTLLGGSNGQFLQTDGNGHLTWANAGSMSGNTGVITSTSNVTLAIEGNTVQIIDANGTSTTGNANVSGNITANGSISGNTVIANTSNTTTLNVTGNSNLGDVSNVHIFGGNAGQVLTTDGNGNLIWASGSSNGNTGMTTNTSNVTMAIGGNTIQVIDGNGTSTTGNANVSGNITANGNVTAGNITTNGAVTTQTLYSNTTIMANGNISSNGTVSGNIIQGNTANFANLNVTGEANLGSAANLTITGGNVGQVLTTADATGNVYWANVSDLVSGGGAANINTTGNLSGGNITSNGTVTSETIYSNTTIFANGNISSNGTVSGNVIQGNTADFAGNVTAGNITSNGTVTSNVIIANTANFSNLNVTGPANLGSAANLTITGGNLGQSLVSYGNGAVTWDFANRIAEGNTFLEIVPNGSMAANVAGNFVMSIESSGVYVKGGMLVEGGNASFTKSVYVTETLQSASTFVYRQASPDGVNSTFALPAANRVSIADGTIAGRVLAASGNAQGNLYWADVSDLISSTPGGSNLNSNVINSNTIVANGNISGDNVIANGNVTANYIIGNGSQLTSLNGANVTGVVANANYAAYAGNVTIAAQSNITSVGTLTSLTVSGNSNLGSNANLKLSGGTNGQVLFTDGAGNLSWVTITANAIFNGNSNVSIPAADGNVNISASGNANVIVVTGNGLNITGKANISNGLTITGGGAQITGDLGLNGNLNVIGNVNYNNVAQLVIGDPLIFIASNNATDVVDSGLVSTYNTNNYTGIVRNKNSGTWTVFDNLNNIPVSTVDWANAGLGKFSAGNTTVSSLTASGIVTLGPVSNVKISGGAAGQLLSTDGTGGLSWVAVSGGANFIANGVSNLQFTSSGGNLIGAVDGTANSFFLSPTVFAAKALSITLGAGNASTMTGGIDYRVAVGYQAGDSSQATNTVAIGNAAGKSSQYANSVAIGPSAGQTAQSFGAVAVGSGSGRQNQGAYSVAIGYLAGYTTQGANSIAIGYGAGATNQHENTIILNATSANLNSGVANSFYVNPVRNDIGNTTNLMYYNATTKEVTYASASAFASDKISNTANAFVQINANNQVVFPNPQGNSGNASIIMVGDGVAMGPGAGGDWIAQARTNWGGRVAIGPISGASNQGFGALAIGSAAGLTSQGIMSIALGLEAGRQNQGQSAVSVGASAGRLNQSSDAVAVGYGAGYTGQGTGAIAIGRYAGNSSQSGNSIAIGTNAGISSQHANTIILNATGANLNSTQANSFYASSVRNSTAANIVFYDPVTKEVTYGISPVTVPNAIANGTSSANFDAAGRFTVRDSVSTFMTLNSQRVSIGSGAGERTPSVFGVAIGGDAGANLQGSAAIALGDTAGYYFQGASAIAIGRNAGRDVQGSNAIAIGTNASANTQGVGSIAIGANSAANNQATNSLVLNSSGLAITANTANAFYVAPVRNATASNVVYYDPATKEMTYGTVGVATGSNFANFAGNVTVAAQPNITSVGTLTSLTVSGNISGANITGNLYGAGNNISNIQGASVVGNVTSAITANFANFAGNVTVAAQPNITSVGTLTSLTVTGNTTSGNFTTTGTVTTANLNATGANVSLGAVGNVKITGGTTGQYLQTNGSGTLTWATVSATAESIANGTSNLGFTAPNGNLIGGIAGTANAFFVSDSMFAVKSEDIVIGKGTDSTVTANRGRVVIGNTAGSLTQGVAGIAIGSGSGKNQTGVGAISIGAGSGYISQGATAIALGYGAGFSGAQGAGGVAIGGNAAMNGQGANSIAIGYHAGKGTGGQPNNSIVINATGADLNAAVANALYVAPIRNITSANTVFYDPATKEMSYGLPTATAATSIVNGTSSVFTDGTSGNVITKVGGLNTLKVDATNGLTVLIGGISMAGPATFGPVNEAFYPITGATGVVTHGCSTGQIFNHTSIAANFTVNLTNLSVATGLATVVTLMLNQGATAYIPNALQIGGVAQTIKWQGGSAPTGNANKLDAVAFTIFRTAASTYVVTGQLVSYG